jgi:hypothetical protein
MTARQVDTEKPAPAAKKRGLFSHIEASPRILLFFFAIVLELAASAVAGVAFALKIAPLWIVGSILWVAWFVVIFIIFNPAADRVLQGWLKVLKRGALGIFITLFILGCLEFGALVFYHVHYTGDTSNSRFLQLVEALDHGLQYNDGTALCHQATNNLLAGENPYAHPNIITALMAFNGSYDRVTPLRVGQFADVFPYPGDQQLLDLWNKSIQHPVPPPVELVSTMCYPAGSFLLPAPFIALGVKDMRIIYIIFVVAALAYTAWQIPNQRRLVFIGVALVSLELWNSIADGETGTLCFALSLVAWIALRKNLWLSAAFMGLAVATKQTAWFLLPFYLILLFRTVPLKKLLYATAVIAGIFLAMNLPFAVMDLRLWFSSLMSPMTDPMFPLGVGAITLVNGGLLDIRSSLPFTVGEVFVFAVALIWYYRNCRRYPQLGPMLAILPLFFAWRSLWNYFFYSAIMALAGQLAAGEEQTVTLEPGAIAES